MDRASHMGRENETSSLNERRSKLLRCGSGFGNFQLHFHAISTCLLFSHGEPVTVRGCPVELCGKMKESAIEHGRSGQVGAHSPLNLYMYEKRPWWAVEHQVQLQMQLLWRRLVHFAY